MLGVDRNAQRMVQEIHRQFKEIPGLLEGKEEALPDYETCITIATTGALKNWFLLVYSQLPYHCCRIHWWHQSHWRILNWKHREWFATCLVHEQCRRFVG
jgi:hypothetical protein